MRAPPADPRRSDLQEREITMNENYGTIWVCMDCMLHEANGECGGCHEGHDEEPLSSIGEGFHAAMGMARDEHECNDDENGIEYRECDCETNSFSTSQCEGCGSYLHGERHAMTLFGPKGE
jgi:hypothetical protein